MPKKDLSHFEIIEEEIAGHKSPGRTDSAALLAWFLENVWRMEPTEVDDAICDGGGDKGIDAIVVDDELLEIAVFQAKHRKTEKTTQGDLDLKNLVGAAVYFQSPQTIDQLIDSKPNAELLRLLRRSSVRERLAEGLHSVKLVFVTNALPDASADDYLETLDSGGSGRIDLWDCDRIGEVAARTRRPDLRSETVTLTAEKPVTVLELTDEERMAVALVPAKELVQLPGIQDYSLFDRNVRLSAGRTKINRQLASTIRSADEHPLFAAYHNGMTLLSSGIKSSGRKLTLNGVGVVNGCQSLLALNENQGSLTDKLLVLVKVIEVPKGSDVADLITQRSNNQNAVNLRDQRSTDPVMRDLQGEVREKYGSEFDFTIRLGEPPKAKNLLDNTAAAQLITAVYREEPAQAVRKLRLFDEDFRKIFNKRIDADKLYFLHMLDKVISSCRSELDGELNASFASVRFTLAYLTAQVLKLSEEGQSLLDRPGDFLPGHRENVEEQLRIIVSDVIGSTNFHVEQSEEEEENFDPKVAFKSASGVRRLQMEVIRQSNRQAKRDKDYLFSAPAAKTAVGPRNRKRRSR